MGVATNLFESSLFKVAETIKIEETVGESSEADS